MAVDDQRSNKDDISAGRRRSLANLVPFKAGESGNLAGRPKTKSMEEMMRGILTESGDFDVNGELKTITEMEDFCRLFLKAAKLSSKDRIALADRLWPALKQLQLDIPSFEKMMDEIGSGTTEQIEGGDLQIGEGDEDE